MATSEMPMSDDERADMMWRLTAAKATVRYIAPGWWRHLVGMVVVVATWVLAAAGILHLGGWWIGAALVYLSVSAWWFGRDLIRALRERTRTKALPVGEQVDALRERWQAIQARPWWSSLVSKGFWLHWIAKVIPRSVVAAYAASVWWPVWVVAAVGGVSAAWPIVNALMPERRTAAAMDMMITRKGPGGLPTPEI